jgi:hypothetical protein
MEHEGSLPHSKQPAVCPYPVPDQYSPCSHSTPWKCILILSFHLRLGLQSRLLPSGFPIITPYAVLISPIRATCHTNLILHCGRLCYLYNKKPNDHVCCNTVAHCMSGSSTFFIAAFQYFSYSGHISCLLREIFFSMGEVRARRQMKLISQS